MATRGLPPPLGPEIPNDNPGLFLGATWRVPTPCSPPRVFSEPKEESLYYPEPQVTPAVAASNELHAGPDLAHGKENNESELGLDLATVPIAPIVVAQPEIPEAVVHASGEALQLVQAEPEPSREPDSLPDGPNDFDRFVKSVVNVALKRGETRAAAALQRFLETQEMCGIELSETSKELLIAGGFVRAEGDRLRATVAVRTVLSAWRRTLTGEDDELDSARDETLDQWASSLLGAWLGCDQDKLPTLRRALRKSGVLAFGMRAA